MNRETRRIVLRLALIIASIAICEFVLRVRSSESPPEPPAYALAHGQSIRPSHTTLWTADPRESSTRASRPLRILVCGDDDAARAADDSDWPSVLARALTRTVGDDSVVVRSAAVAGFSALQGERILREELDSWAPDLVLLHFGSANEYQPPLHGRPDQEWLDAVGGRSDRSRLLLLDRIRAAIDLPAPEDRPASAAVRVDGVRFERALERMIAATREAGACPIVVEPVRRASQGAQDREDSIAGVYRQVAARVAGVYGAPFVPLQRALALDRGPFRHESRLLSARGAKVVARECLRTLLSDTTVLVALQRWLERNASAPEAALVAGTFGLMRTILAQGPAANPADTVVDVLLRAKDRGDAIQKRAACLRLALARHRGDAIDETLAILDSCASDGEDLDRVAVRAALAILSGRSAEARDALRADSGADGAVASTLLGISLLTSDAAAANARFDRASELDPSLALSDLWRAKSALIAGDARTAGLYCDVALRTKDCHGSGAAGIQIAGSASGRVEEFLNSDPILFGTAQRSAMPRLLFALAVDSVTRRPDAVAHLERGFALRAGGDADGGARAIARAVDQADAADFDTLMTCIWFALESRELDVARLLLAKTDGMRGRLDVEFASAVLAVESGDPVAAIPLLDAVIERRPDDPRVRYYSATARFAAGDVEGARRDAESAAKRWPAHPGLLQLLDRIGNAARKS